MEWDNRSTFVNIKTYPGKAEEVYGKLQKDPNVLGCFMTAGQFDIFCWIDSQNMGNAYNWIRQIRAWSQVERTSCCPVYNGYWNEKPYQNKRYFGWLKARANNSNSPYEYLKNSPNTTFAFSVPGDYDCYALYCFDDYDGFYDQVKQLRNQGNEVEFYAPFKFYWNPKCDKKWQEYEKNVCQPQR